MTNDQSMTKLPMIIAAKHNQLVITTVGLEWTLGSGHWSFL